MANPGRNPREVNLTKPDAYNGNPGKFVDFWAGVYVYLTINNDVYHDDKRKIGFVLNLLTAGNCRLWRANWIRKNFTDAFEVKDGVTWTTFAEEVK